MNHNRQQDGFEGQDHDQDEDGELHEAAVSAAERLRATTKRDQIATDMWVDYQAELERRQHLAIN
jgi:hypothetical protein